MTLVQSGADFTGTTNVTGPTCVRKGSSKGSIDGSQIKFGWLAAARTVQFVGTLSGDSMSGTWTATACTAAIDISGTWAAHRTSP